MITPKNIVVATDFGKAAETALEYGRNFARAFSATLHVVHVVDDVARSTAAIAEDPSVNLGGIQLELERDARLALDSMVTDDDRRTLRIEPAVLRSHSPAQAILNYAAESAVDLIILGTHGRTGLAQFFLGSVAQKIVRSAPCPVLTVREVEREFVRPDALQVTTSSDQHLRPLT